MLIYFTTLYNLFRRKSWKNITGVGLILLVGWCGFAFGCSSNTVSDPTGGNAGATSLAATGTGGTPGTATGGTPGTATAGTPGTATAGVGGETAPSGPTSFSAELLESVQEIPLPSMSFTVKALDNATGQPLGFETVSTDKSNVFFENLPAGPVAFLVVGQAGISIDTYQFNLDANDKNETVWVVALSSVTTAPSLANITLDPEKGVAAGAIYWVDGTGVEWPIGCANVTIDGGVGEIRYFASNNMPTTDVFREEFPDQDVRTNSNPNNGKYYIGNANPGSHTVSATLNGQDLGSTTLVVIAGKDSSDGEYTISISNIYVQGAANPTPADCI